MELTPRATAGMAVGAQVPQPRPTAIATARMGTEVPRGIHGARSSGGRRHGVGGHRRRRLGMRGFSLTQGAVRFRSQSGTRLGLLGACPCGRERLTLSGPGVLGALTWSGLGEPEEEPHECDQRQLGEKKRRHPGNAPSDGGDMRALDRVFALSELSAGLGHTTWWRRWPCITFASVPICSISQLERASGFGVKALSAETHDPLQYQRCLCTRRVRSRGRSEKVMWYETCWRQWKEPVFEGGYVP